MFICSKCEEVVKGIDKNGICFNCTENEVVKNIVQTSLPEGLVAFWIDKSSYISIKKNQRYFKIPDNVKKSIIEGVYYQIIIREVKDA